MIQKIKDRHLVSHQKIPIILPLVAETHPSAESATAASFKIPESISGSQKLSLGLKIDLNQATYEDLVALPAIGDKMALRILETRKKIGGFRKLEDLMKVKGIKEKKFEFLKKHLTLK
ncbi:MAG: helix-hairpin-helix domain-containing protein [Deltaproteobacteria bacterium]|nr:helix-hairpin-helix domain-containing protein [Deltaproteobacteria bacterium]